MSKWLARSLAAEQRIGKDDRLLRFVSEKGCGRWQEFKDAFDFVFMSSDDPAHKAWIKARDLSALGHLEICWGENASWCATPPVLTMLPRSGGRGFITGARTEYFEGRLHELIEEHQLYLHEDLAPHKGPTTILIAFNNNQEAKELASALGIGYTYSVAEELAALLSPLASLIGLCEARDLPMGFENERLDPDVLHWVPVETVSQPGLYRCRTFQRNEHRLHLGGSSWLNVDPEIGKYEVLRWDGRCVIEYREEAWELAVPARAPLPLLHDRAATLCSGQLARFDSGQLVYQNVPPAVAEGIRSSLCQDAEAARCSDH